MQVTHCDVCGVVIADYNRPRTVITHRLTSTGATRSIICKTVYGNPIIQGQEKADACRSCFRKWLEQLALDNQ